MLILFIVVAVIAAGAAVYYGVLISAYRKTNYYKATGNGFFEVRHDAGKYGEYLIYRQLRYLEKQGARFLFNLYLPKEDGTTAEVDAALLTRYGIFVFESKNYSGWIFGSERQSNWTQTLPQGKGRKAHREQFYNPILQNRTHIRCLKAVAGEGVPMWSVIVFSERCELKKITVESPDVHVVKRNDIEQPLRAVIAANEPALSGEDIARLYELLYPYSQVSDEVKGRHIAEVETRKKV